MEILTGKSLERALLLCDQHPGARVGIACATHSSAKVFIDSLWDEVSNGRMPGWEIGKDAMSTEAVLRRKFRPSERNHPETSYIEIFTPHSEEYIQGKSYHLVLYEKYMNERIVVLLAYAERLQFLDADAEEDDGAELDEFLNSFKLCKGGVLHEVHRM